MGFFKKHIATFLLCSIFLLGAGLLAYPSFSDYWNSFHQSRAIASYAERVAGIDDNHYREMLDEAEAYNAKLKERGFSLGLSKEEEDLYTTTLDVTGTGIMAYIEIPSIGCSLPIYHGTDEGVLQIAIGHLAGTALPIGGEGTHCVLSGHRGLPSAKLFTDIDQLTEGDQFLIRTLDEVLTYEVDKITIVEPAEVDALKPEKGKDYCTLVTCTPYGVNTHRLLVRGHRVETRLKSQIRVTADAVQIDTIIVAPIIAVPMILILLMWLLIATRKKNR